MTAPTVQIRDAELADAPQILALVKALAEYEQLSSQVEATLADVERELFGPNAVARALVAVHAGERVGIAIWFHNFSTFLSRRGVYLEDLFVLPEHRGHGIGRALLVELARRAHALGCGRMEWSVLDWNAPAIGFYESLGARAVAGWSGFRLDAAGIATLAAQ
ncbi:MAG: GNAT family N-acetyltransferase [Deltaproteobacteria bacterium]|nr:GNAT family N-acetyltransferase [Nannocystaceae bacterium]